MLKDYSFRAKKTILILLHLLFLTLAVAGIGIIHMNTTRGSGIATILNEDFENSAGFQEMFQTNLNEVFQYVSYRDVFETDGYLDLSKEMFSVSRGGSPEIIYTLEEVLRYAKSQGFYLNDKFEIVNDLYLYDNASTATDQIVNWRAYPTDHQISEPGDAYVSLLELSREVLTCLSSYYKVYYHMIVNPSNFYFQIFYTDEDEEIISYSNCYDYNLDELLSLGRYCYFNSDTAMVDSNLPSTPNGISLAMENNNFYDTPDYYMIAAVDTDYYEDDIYATQRDQFDRTKELLKDGLLVLAVGIIGCLISLLSMIRLSGYQSSDPTTPTLYSFDMITTESCLALTCLCAYFALFLGEKVGFRLIHLIFTESSWPFIEKLCQAVILYGCCMVGAFSLLRRYKTGQLWKNSSLRKFKLGLEDYFADRTFAHRLFCQYLTFLAVQLAGFSCIIATIHFRTVPAAKILAIVVIAALAAYDYHTYRSLFLTSGQEDRIADAIKKIADGDISYQMDLDGLSGKELKIAQQINQIGTSLERALQEQVKSERLKADLITNVSHDIKTPLTSIINYIDLIRREHIPNDRVQEYLTVLEQKSQRLKTLTEDLVEASKASSGNLKMDMARLNFVEMIWQTNGEFEEKYSERHLELISTLPESGLTIEADGRHLWRILENLYNNAYKYAMENSRVYTDVASENGMAWFTIKNVSEHPLNISTDELTERFVRGDVSRTTEGSGLGLSIAQSLTKLQGGTFEIIIDGDLFKVRVGFPLLER